MQPSLMKINPMIFGITWASSLKELTVSSWLEEHLGWKSLFISRWRAWEQKKYLVRTKAEEGKKVMIGCSSGHIATGPVPAGLHLKCPHLKATEHTQSFPQGEKPCLHLVPQAPIFQWAERKKYMQLKVTGRDFQLGQAWSYSLGDELQQPDTVCWHCPVHWQGFFSADGILSECWEEREKFLKFFWKLGKLKDSG